MNEPHVNELIECFLDGSLVGEDRASLERELLASPQARNAFWQRAKMHAALRKWGREHWGRAAATGADTCRAAGRGIVSRSMTAARRHPGIAAAAVIVPIVTIMVLAAAIRRGETPQADGAIASVASPEPAIEGVAALNAAVEPIWADPNVELILQRGLLPRGPIHLLSGRVELLFRSGGTAVIEGPAVFEPVAADRLRVSEGSVRCRCPQLGTELRVETPQGTVTDLGTEFVAIVRPDASLRVGVIEGSVRLDLAGATKTMAAGEAVSVDAAGHATDDIGSFRDFGTRARLTPFDDVGFTGGVNLLADPSFESSAASDSAGRAADREPPFRKAILAFGPWSCTPGHVESVMHPLASGNRAVRIAARGNPFWPLVVQRCGTGDISGATVMAAVKAAHVAGDPLAGQQRAIVKISFVDDAGKEFARAERHFLKAGGPDDRFVEGRIAAIAPPGTHGVNYTVLLNADGRPTGSIVVDDAKLVISK